MLLTMLWKIEKLSNLIIQSISGGYGIVFHMHKNCDFWSYILYRKLAKCESHVTTLIKFGTLFKFANSQVILFKFSGEYLFILEIVL